MENIHYLKTKFKSSLLAYLCYFIFMGHYAYLGMWAEQMFLWLLLISPFVGFIAFPGVGMMVGIITWPVMAVWLLIDLFTIPRKVDRYNRFLAKKISELEMNERIRSQEIQNPIV